MKALLAFSLIGGVYFLIWTCFYEGKYQTQLTIGTWILYLLTIIVLAILK